MLQTSASGRSEPTAAATGAATVASAVALVAIAVRAARPIKTSANTRITLRAVPTGAALALTATAIRAATRDTPPDLCEWPTHNSCNSHGSCSAGGYDCTGGYTGTDCQTPPNFCECPARAACGGHVSCSAGSCRCTGGWSGPQCNIDPPCTATAGGLGPDVPWAAATDGTALAVYLVADVTAAVGTPCRHNWAPVGTSAFLFTIAIANAAGDLRTECGKPAGGASAEGELCAMVDRLEVTAEATLFLRGLLFQGLRGEGGGGWGGAIYLHSSGAAATVVKCIFRHNFALGSGGAIRAGPGTTLTVRGSHFANKTADTGGAIGFDCATSLAISGTSFTVNTATAETATAPYGPAVCWADHFPQYYINEEASAAFGGTRGTSG